MKHRVLRRPYVHTENVAAHFDPYPMLWDCVYIQAECAAPLRIKATRSDIEEPVLEMTVSPRSIERFMLLAVHNLPADQPVAWSIKSMKPFKILLFDAHFMHPPFRRVDGMIVYHNPGFKTHPEPWRFGHAQPHHRKIYGSGKDVGYLCLGTDVESNE